MIPGERQHPLLHHGALHVVIDQDHVFLESLDGEEFLFALQLCEQHLMDVTGVLSGGGPEPSPGCMAPPHWEADREGGKQEVPGILDSGGSGCLPQGNGALTFPKLPLPRTLMKVKLSMLHLVLLSQILP